MNNNFKKSSGLISLLLVLAMGLTLTEPAFAQVREGGAEYGKTNYTEESAFPLAETASGAAISETSTPGALGYEFDAGNKEITKYTGTETEIVIPGEFDVDGEAVTVESIGENAFANNKKIVRVTAGESIKTIRNNAFSGCSKLEEVILGNNVKEIVLCF